MRADRFARGRSAPGQDTPPGAGFPYIACMSADSLPLKRGLHRSVWLSEDGDAVVKRFHSRGAWRRASDGRRARREARMQSRLATFGLPVPRLLGVLRTQNGWEVRSEALTASRSLEALLEDQQHGSIELTLASASELGDALARFHAAGFLHGDLHPGNLLEVPGRGWFLIDVVGGTLLRTPVPARMLAEFAGLLGAVRERTSVAWRRALWSAWRAGRAGLGIGAQLAEETEWDQLELEARRLRHASVKRHADRWLRVSSRLHPFTWLEREWLVDARTPTGEAAVQQLAASDLACAEGRTLTGTGLVLVSGTGAEAQWCNAARATEHALRTPRPLAFDAANSIAVFEGSGASAARPLEARDAGAQQLAENLADRGLWIDTPPLVEQSSSGNWMLSPEQALPRAWSPGPQPRAMWFPNAEANTRGGARG